jgi:hypothetical protein
LRDSKSYIIVTNFHIWSNYCPTVRIHTCFWDHFSVHSLLHSKVTSHSTALTRFRSTALHWTENWLTHRFTNPPPFIRISRIGKVLELSWATTIFRLRREGLDNSIRWEVRPGYAPYSVPNNASPQAAPPNSHLICCQSIQVYCHNLRLAMYLDHVDYIVNPRDHPVRAFSGWLKLRRLRPDQGQAIQQSLVSFLESRGNGHAVIAGLHPVFGHIQMLTGIMTDVMQPFHEVRRLTRRIRKADTDHSGTWGVVAMFSRIMASRKRGGYPLNSRSRVRRNDLPQVLP